jgi:hypothetical protein
MTKRKTSKYKRDNPNQDERYARYVKHSRFGRGPRLTGLDVETDMKTASVFLHWHSPPESRIPGTAVAADVSRQRRPTIPVTHYYDVKRGCRDCGRPFIFFAEEQKHWYEKLGFPLEVDCLRCQPCRREQHGIARKRERYEELFHVKERSRDETLEMAECCLSLIEEGIFHKRQALNVRKLLQQAGEGKQCDGLQARLAALGPKTRVE